MTDIDRPESFVLRGSAPREIADTVRVGTAMVANHRFDDGSEELAATLVFSIPDATSPGEWVRAGMVVHAGSHAWRITRIAAGPPSEVELEAAPCA